MFRMLALYLIWAVLLLKIGPGASSSKYRQEDRWAMADMKKEIGTLKIKLDEVSLEYTKLSESYGKLVKAIMASIMQYLYNNLVKT